MGQNERVPSLASQGTFGDFNIFAIDSCTSELSRLRNWVIHRSSHGRMAKGLRRRKCLCFSLALTKRKLCAVSHTQSERFCHGHVGVLFSGYMAAKEMWPYAEFKSKYAKPIKRKGFPEALEEVENNPNVVHVPAHAEPPTTVGLTPTFLIKAWSPISTI